MESRMALIQHRFDKLENSDHEDMLSRLLSTSTQREKMMPCLHEVLKEPLGAVFSILL
jgi:hypothetical protein